MFKIAPISLIIQDNSISLYKVLLNLLITLLFMPTLPKILIWLKSLAFLLFLFPCCRGMVEKMLRWKLEGICENNILLNSQQYSHSTFLAQSSSSSNHISRQTLKGQLFLCIFVFPSIFAFPSPTVPQGDLSCFFHFHLQSPLLIFIVFGRPLVWVFFFLHVPVAFRAVIFFLQVKCLAWASHAFNNEIKLFGKLRRNDAWKLTRRASNSPTCDCGGKREGTLLKNKQFVKLDFHHSVLFPKLLFHLHRLPKHSIVTPCYR